MNQSTIRPIRTEDDHTWALTRIDELMDAEPGTSQFDELEVLAQLVEIYEEQRWPIGMPAPIAAIKFRMEQGQLTRRDLEPYIGSSGKVSEVLSGKQPLTLKMIRSLHKHLGIPADVLLGDPVAKLEEDGLAEIAGKYPLSEMQSTLKTFDSFGDPKNRAEEALRWLAERAGISPTQVAAYCRKNDEARQNAKMDVFALQGWCLHVLAQAATNKLPNIYEPGSITSELLRQVATLSSLPQGPQLAVDVLAQQGIHLIIAPHLKKTYLDGAAMLLRGEAPVVALTLRYRRLDSFWHSLLHELVHVKNDLGKNQDRLVIYDDFNLPSANSEIERRADIEAAEALVPQALLPATLASMEKMDTDTLLSIARRARVHPAIVAGRVRHETQNWRKFARIVSEANL